MPIGIRKSIALKEISAPKRLINPTTLLPRKLKYFNTTKTPKFDSIPTARIRLFRDVCLPESGNAVISARSSHKATKCVITVDINKYATSHLLNKKKNR